MNILPGHWRVRGRETTSTLLKSGEKWIWKAERAPRHHRSSYFTEFQNFYHSPRITTLYLCVMCTILNSLWIADRKSTSWLCGRLIHSLVRSSGRRSPNFVLIDFTFRPLTRPPTFVWIKEHSWLKRKRWVGLLTPHIHVIMSGGWFFPFLVLKRAILEHKERAFNRILIPRTVWTCRNSVCILFHNSAGYFVLSRSSVPKGNTGERL